MEYKIDISINLLKRSNISEIESDVVYLAKQTNCQHVYVFSETEGMLKNPICKYVINVSFIKDSINDMIRFIKLIKQNKNVHIECVYKEDNVIKMIYVSNAYLKTLNKTAAKNYKMAANYSEDENMILQEF